jgi:Ras GTPase-activating-like protein IQGAP2/3
VSFREALEDYNTRGEYIRRENMNFCLSSILYTDLFLLDLQLLQWWTETFVAALIQSTQRMPYGMRYLARETLHALKVGSDDFGF